MSKIILTIIEVFFCEKLRPSTSCLQMWNEVPFKDKISKMIITIFEFSYCEIYRPPHTTPSTGRLRSMFVCAFGERGGCLARRISKIISIFSAWWVLVRMIFFLKWGVFSRLKSGFEIWTIIGGGGRSLEWSIWVLFWDLYSSF